MKEIVVIPKDDLVYIKPKYNKMERYIKEPETFEELKELCKDLEGKNVFITCGGECIEFNGLSFWQDGRISHDADQSMYAIKLDVTPARQWNIIKSLIGEE